MKATIIEWGGRLVLVLFSVVVGFVIFEGFLQFRYRSGHSVLPYGLRGDNLEETFYIGFFPNFVGVSRQSHVEYRTNALGFRDDPLDPSQEHLLFLGDSRVVGLNIPHAETYPEQVEQRLQEKGYAVQSVNTSTPGQGTVSQLRILDELLDRPYLHPRAVILGFSPNDLSNNLWFENYLNERRGFFEITRSTMQQLRKAKLPESIVKTLKSLKNRKISEEELWQYLEQEIGEEQTDKYKDRILTIVGGQWRKAVAYPSDINEPSPLVQHTLHFSLRTWLYIKTFSEIVQGRYAAELAQDSEEGQKNSREYYQNKGEVNEYGEYLHRPGREVEWDWLSRKELLTNRSYQATVRTLREIIILCRKHNLPLIFFIFHSGEKEFFSEESPLYKELLREELEKSENVYFIDILDEFRRYLKTHGQTTLPPEFYSFEGDHEHPGPLLCTLISEALEPVIIHAMQRGQD